MKLDPTQLKALAELVADIVECRLARTGNTISDDSRLLALSRDIKALGPRFDEFPLQLRRIQEVAADHDFAGLGKRIDDAREAEGHDPGDHLGAELSKLERKLRRLQDEDSDDYEYKVPLRKQIKLEILNSILIEILEILRKLYRRSYRAEG